MWWKGVKRERETSLDKDRQEGRYSEFHTHQHKGHERKEEGKVKRKSGWGIQFGKLIKTLRDGLIKISFWSEEQIWLENDDFPLSLSFPWWLFHSRIRVVVILSLRMEIASSFPRSEKNLLPFLFSPSQGLSFRSTVLFCLSFLFLFFLFEYSSLFFSFLEVVQSLFFLFIPILILIPLLTFLSFIPSSVLLLDSLISCIFSLSLCFAFESLSQFFSTYFHSQYIFFSTFLLDVYDRLFSVWSIWRSNKWQRVSLCWWFLLVLMFKSRERKEERERRWWQKEEKDWKGWCYWDREASVRRRQVQKQEVRLPLHHFLQTLHFHDLETSMMMIVILTPDASFLLFHSLLNCIRFHFTRTSSCIFPSAVVDVLVYRSHRLLAINTSRCKR